MKNIHQKKRKSDKCYTIATAGRTDKDSNTCPLFANLANSNNAENLKSHYNQLIERGLDPLKVELVVTDMLAGYAEVIDEIFPNALQQYCIFHIIQNINKILKESLKAHRQKKFKCGERKEAHLISFLLLKGQEKLTEEERNKVLDFCIKYPDVHSNYALKEDIRFLYANAETVSEACAYKDIINDSYSNCISPEMNVALVFLNTHFEKSISYLKKGYMRDKTNNDAERMMRTIKRIQKTHNYLRKGENFIKKVGVMLGFKKAFAA